MDTEIQAKDGEGHEQRRKSKRSRPVTVDIIKREDEGVLVEWLDKSSIFHRVSIPAEELSGNTADEETLAQGIPYGEDWAAHFAEFPNADKVANDLHRRGIWTAQDFKKHSADARAAVLQNSVNPAIAGIIRTMEV